MATEHEHRPGAVLVVEDDSLTRSMISTVLLAAGYASREASSGEEAIEIARREQPRLVLLDIRLPGLSGYEVCGWLRGKFGESVPIIFLSGERIEAFDRAAGLMLGADDYLVKPFSNEELVARVRGLLRRTLPVPRVLAAKLTLRELEVLRLLAGGLGQTEIALQLRISARTVGTHIEHILMKLGVQSRTQAVALAYREHLIEPEVAPAQQPPVSIPARSGNGSDAHFTNRNSTPVSTPASPAAPAAQLSRAPLSAAKPPLR